MGPLIPTPTMDAIYDLIEEAKLRFLWWAMSIFAISYFITHTSKSIWMNVPISILFVAALRVLLNKVEFRWKVQPQKSQTYLSHLGKKQLSLNEVSSSPPPPPPKWKRKIDSPVVENALNDFIDLILRDFVVNLWYSDITPDGEFPEQIRYLVMDALAEVSVRVKELNIVDLLLRNIVDLIGDHIDLFRRNQAAIGVDVMLTLSSEERDERLKFHLLNSKELHPALISPEIEYKVLQRLMSGVLAIVLRQQEAQCPVIRSIAREILTCFVMQPVMNLASPGYINELIETLLPFFNEGVSSWMGGDLSTNETICQHGHSVATGGEYDNHAASADWAQMLEAATQRRTEVLMPENLENMWTKGRNYRRRQNKIVKAGFQKADAKNSSVESSLSDRNHAQGTTMGEHKKYAVPEGKSLLPLMHTVDSDPLLNVGSTNRSESSPGHEKELSSQGEHQVDVVKYTKDLAFDRYKKHLKRSNSASVLGADPNKEGSPISEFYNHEFERHGEGFWGKSGSEMIVRREGQLVPKLRCRVMGAYFEKLRSSSFAVYSIAVTDGQDRTWFVNRRYRNFEQLHRLLKDIPNYTLHLPPKRIFYSSTDDAFVHQRCLQLDKYLQDLLSIANIAEQHEVWDFLSASSKSYSFGKSSSMMRTLAVNVDDAVDDIVRQFKGVSDGLMRKVIGSSSPTYDGSSASFSWNFSGNADELNKSISRQSAAESVLSSDNEEGKKEADFDHENIDREVPEDGWNSDNELSSKGYSPRVIHPAKESDNMDVDRKHDVMLEVRFGKDVQPTNFALPHNCEDPVEVPPEWTPPNVSVPILNLVDKIFQLQKRGWLRRQVFWISKQILQLVMADAIDDLLLREIHWLRRADTIAYGIRWVQDILWPGGTFFLRLQAPLINGSGISQRPFQTKSESGGIKITKSESGSFEEQLEAARRASDVKKLLFDGAPAALVSLIGQKQYRRCASDIYYFSQSSICVKQLAYAILELLLISIFPEMRNVVMSVHENMHVHQPV